MSDMKRVMVADTRLRLEPPGQNGGIVCSAATVRGRDCVQGRAQGTGARDCVLLMEI